MRQILLPEILIDELFQQRGDRRIVRGYASTEAMDQDGEIILQNGIDFERDALELAILFQRTDEVAQVSIGHTL